MQPSRIYGLAALLSLVCIFTMAIAFGSPDAVRLLQPSLPGTHNADFYQAIRETPRVVLAFMATDTLFIFGYLTLLVGLYQNTGAHSHILAGVALLFGLVGGGLDMLENSYLTTYALQSLYGHPLDKPALPFIYVIAAMKWYSVFFSTFLFGILWRRDSIFHGLLVAFMLAFPLVGLLSIAVPELQPARPIPLVISIAMLGWWFTVKGNSSNTGVE